MIAVIDPLKLDDLLRDRLLMLPSADLVIDVTGGIVDDIEGVSKRTGLPQWALEEMARMAEIRTGSFRVPTGREILAARRAAADGDARRQQLIKTNPFDKTSGHFNITRQVELRRDNPTLAAELQSLVGQVYRH